MHGAGNDFVLIDARGLDIDIDPELAARIAHRRLGIGCDQVLVLRHAAAPEHAAQYEIWNSDGSRAAQCGNGARCIGLYLEMSGDQPVDRYVLESPSGVVTMRRCEDGEYEVEMGTPSFEAAAVPVNLEPAQARYHLASPWGRLEFGAASMGNPHALLVYKDIQDPEIPAIGEFLSKHEAFPDGCNVGFAQLVNTAEIRLRVVERGAGETLACGSGACAAVAILQRAGKLDEIVDVFLPGGHLVIKWHRKEGPLMMKGPARHIFEGTLNE
jgi:diaminopimelate epimerase